MTEGATLFNHRLDRYPLPKDEARRLLGAASRSAILSRKREREGDVVQLPASLEHTGAEAWIRGHYARCRLEEIGEFLYCDVPVIAGQWYPEYELSAAMFTREFDEQRPDKRFLAAVRDWDDKNKFVKKCERLGVPTPPTETFPGLEAFCSRSYDTPKILKVAVSAGGRGVWYCADNEALQAQVLKLNGAAFQVQEPLRQGAVFLNVQYELKRGDIRFVGTTEQILAGFSHVGNRFPTEHDPQSVTDPLAKAAAADGMQGIVGFDVAVVRSRGDVRFLLLECNPRFNDSTYYIAAAKRLGLKKGWESRVLPCDHRSYDDLGNIIRAPLEYNPETKLGIVVVNWGSLPQGMIGVLVAGPRAARPKYLHGLTQLIGD